MMGVPRTVVRCRITGTVIIGRGRHSGRLSAAIHAAPETVLLRPEKRPHV